MKRQKQWPNRYFGLAKKKLKCKMADKRKWRAITPQAKGEKGEEEMFVVRERHPR